MEDKELLQLVCDIGYDMLSYGGEIYRVEETVRHICRAYGVKRVDVFAIPNAIIVSFFHNDESYSHTYRAVSKGSDLDKLDKLNDLSRKLCRETPDYKEARRMLEEVHSGKEYSLLTLSVTYGAAALVFALFFGGNWKDGLWAFPIGVSIKVVSYFLERRNASRFFITVICGTISALLSGFGVRIGFLSQVSNVLMGAIMNLVPGIVLTNAMRDIMAGDFISGLMRIAEAILVGAAIAVGVMVPLSFFRSFLGTSVIRSDFNTCIYAAAGVVIFGIIFNLRGKKLLVAAIGGTIGWVSYLLTGLLVQSDIFSYFIASVVTTVFAEIFARLHKVPATVYLVTCLIPLVPGGGIYRTMAYCIVGENSLFLETGLHTLEISAVIGLAVIVVSTLVQMIFSGKEYTFVKRLLRR